MERPVLVESATTEDGVDLWPTYQAVFADHPDLDTWLAEVWERHRVRRGFRLARCHSDDELAGFAYGYTGEHGQWWTDHVAAVMDPEVAQRWLGGHFELVSIGVSPGFRGRGLGRALMHTLCRGLPHERLLLTTTADPTDPARRLYESDGWRVLGPGIGPGTVVMGRLARPECV